MKFDIRVLRPGETPAFAGLTFPAYGPVLAGTDEGRVAVGLFADGEAAGLALGIVPPASAAQGTALSILVTSVHRGRGAGTQLLMAFEREMADRGCARITGRVTGSDDRSLPVERLLQRAGWQFDGPSSVLCHAQESIISAPWLANAELPPGVELFPWLELRTAERADMLARQRRDRWIPERLDPFWNEPLIAACSMGLREGGRVVGWCVTYRFDRDTLRWWRLFVEPELQGLGRAIPLLAETIRHALDSGFRHGLWSVSANNRAMMRLLERRMRPYLASARPVWVVTKAVTR